MVVLVSVLNWHPFFLPLTSLSFACALKAELIPPCPYVKFLGLLLSFVSALGGKGGVSSIFAYFPLLSAGREGGSERLRGAPLPSELKR